MNRRRYQPTFGCALGLVDPGEFALPGERDHDRPVETGGIGLFPSVAEALVLGIEPEFPTAIEVSPVGPHGLGAGMLGLRDGGFGSVREWVRYEKEKSEPDQGRTNHESRLQAGVPTGRTAREGIESRRNEFDYVVRDYSIGKVRGETLPVLDRGRCAGNRSNRLQAEHLGIDIELLAEGQARRIRGVVVDDDQGHVVVGGTMFAIPCDGFQQGRTDGGGAPIG